MKKSVMTIILACFMMLALTACGGNPPTGEPEEETPSISTEDPESGGEANPEGGTPPEAEEPEVPQTAEIPQEAYELMLVGDFSWFTGLWENGEGWSFTLNADGSIVYDGDPTAPTTATYDGSCYDWGANFPVGGTHVTLYPVGIPDRWDLGSDTTKIRIENGQAIPNSAAELYYLTEPSGSGTPIVPRGEEAPFTEEEAKAFAEVHIRDRWGEGVIDIDYEKIVLSNEPVGGSYFYFIDYGLFRLGAGQILVFSDGRIIPDEDSEFEGFNKYFDFDISYWRD